MIITDSPRAAFQARILFDRLTGGFARAGAALAQRIQWGELKPGRPTILCLQRALFAKDIAELKKRTDLNLPCLRAAILKKPQSRWIAPAYQRQSHLWFDLNHDLAHVCKDLERFGIAFLDAASRTRPIDAVLAANTDYWQDEALRLACRTRGIPFLALSRESYGISRSRDYVADYYRKGGFYFNGAGCAVASETCVRFLTAQPALRDATVRATGWPRYDAWRDLQMPPLSERRAVTIMAYGDPEQLLYAAENFRDVVTVVAAAATAQQSLPENERTRFIIKMKKRSDAHYISAIRPDLADLGIELTVETPIPELAAQSRLIVGYNTLAVLEGLLADCAIAVPMWSDSECEAAAALLHPDDPEDNDVCYFPRSQAAFAELLQAALAGSLPAKGTRSQRLARFSRHCVVEQDVTASARFETFVRSLLPH